MTVFGSICTRSRTDRTLICNAILYHFQITLFCGRINRPSSHSHFFSSRAHLSNSSLFVSATSQQKYVSSPPTRPQRFMLPRNSKVDIDDISSTLKPFFKSPARDDLLINFLVSVFTSYKNLRSVAFNLGRMCWKQISSLFTIKSHKESLSPILLFCALVVTPDIVRALSLFLARVVGWYIFDDSFI